MAKTAANTIPNLYSELNRLGQSGEYERSLKICNKILGQDSNEVSALHCKVVCLERVGRFEEALSVINKSQIGADLSFEKAYALYRLNRILEAHDVLEEVAKPDRRIQELLAQILYRLENFSACFELYRKLIKNTQDEYEDERDANLSAVLAAMAFQGGKIPVNPSELSNKTYELSYNAASLSLALGDLKGTLKLLKDSEKLCREMQDEELTEEELEEELAAIRVQRGYALQRLNKNPEALIEYNMAIKARPDVAVTAVAANNIVAINKDQNVFDSRKKMKSATADKAVNFKLMSRQKKAILMNQCLLHYHMNQGDQVRSSIKTLRKSYPNSPVPLLLLAAQLLKDKKITEASALLKEVSDSGDCISPDLMLSRAQIELNKGNIGAACEALSDLGDEKYSIGVVATLVSLYKLEKNLESASTLLKEAVHFWSSSSTDSAQLDRLMSASVDFHLSYEPQTSAELLIKLRKRRPKDLHLLAKLISAYSKFDAKLAQQAQRELPSTENIASDIDVKELEASITQMAQLRWSKKSGKHEASPIVKIESVGKKKKKKRKGKLPKSCIPGAEVDPERWLPRWERSYYRGRRKDKKRDNIGTGTQGATPVAGAGDFVKSATPSSDVGSPQTGPRQQRPVASKKTNKKKKGKR